MKKVLMLAVTAVAMSGCATENIDWADNVVTDFEIQDGAAPENFCNTVEDLGYNDSLDAFAKGYATRSDAAKVFDTMIDEWC